MAMESEVTKRSHRLAFGLLTAWLAVNLYSAVLVPSFWSGGCLFAIGLAYSSYYAWSRVIRGSGQAGIVLIERQSPTYAKVCADLAMLFMAAISLLVLLGQDHMLRQVLH